MFQARQGRTCGSISFRFESLLTLRVQCHIFRKKEGRGGGGGEKGQKGVRKEKKNKQVTSRNRDKRKVGTRKGDNGRTVGQKGEKVRKGRG
jgi:hypothetical protein